MNFNERVIAMSNHKVEINQDKCIGCGMCVKTCVSNNIELIEKKANTKLNDCLMCAQCLAICPVEAIHLTGFEDKPIEKTKDIKPLNPEDVLNTIRFRRTIRQFKDKAVPDNVVQDILEAGRLTHTAKNMQDVSFIILDKEKKELEELAVNLFKKIKPVANLTSPLARNKEINDDFFFFKAPLVIVVVSNSETNGVLAAQNMEFMAEAHGLGVLYSGYFTRASKASRKIKQKLNIPKGKQVATTLVIGYPSIEFKRSTPHEKLDVTYL